MWVIAALSALLLTGCAPAPDNYPIPPQHQPIQGRERLAHGDFVQATDPEAANYLLTDIRGLEGNFRWTGANPEMRFFLKTTERLHFRLEFGVHPILLKEVGPLEFTIEVNGHFLAEVREGNPGNKTVQKAVPPQWLAANADNRVKIRVRNPWLTPDRSYLGFVFLAAGFVE